MKELSIEEMTALRGGLNGLGGFHGSYAPASHDDTNTGGSQVTPTNPGLKINSGGINRGAQVAGSPSTDPSHTHPDDRKKGQKKAVA